MDNMKLDEYLERFAEEISRKLSTDQKKLIEEYEKSKTVYLNQCEECMKKLIEQCKQKQEQGQKDVVGCIGVHFLRTSVRTRSFEYKIAMYNTELFQDRQEVAVYWEPPYLRKIAEEAVKDLSSMLRKECIRISDYDIKQFCDEYLFLLMKWMPMEIVEKLEKICDMEEFRRLQHEEVVELYQGEYLLEQERLKEVVCIGKGGVL